MAYSTGSSGAFNPIGNTVTFLANTLQPTPVQVTYTPASNNAGYSSYYQYRVFNAGSSLIFLGYGANATIANNNANAVVSTTGNNIPVLPGSLEIISAPANSFFTAITASGTSQVYITPGFGI